MDNEQLASFWQMCVECGIDIRQATEIKRFINVLICGCDSDLELFLKGMLAEKAKESAD